MEQDDRRTNGGRRQEDPMPDPDETSNDERRGGTRDRRGGIGRRSGDGPASTHEIRILSTAVQSLTGQLEKTRLDLDAKFQAFREESAKRFLARGVTLALFGLLVIANIALLGIVSKQHRDAVVLVRSTNDILDSAFYAGCQGRKAQEDILNRIIDRVRTGGSLTETAEQKAARDRFVEDALVINRTPSCDEQLKRFRDHNPDPAGLPARQPPSGSTT